MMSNVPPPICYREESLLVVPRLALMPPRCVKCNAPAQMEPVRGYRWSHPFVYPSLLAYCALLIAAAQVHLILAAPLLVGLVVIAQYFDHSGGLSFGVCAKHRRQRRRHELIGWVFLAEGFGLLILGGMDVIEFVRAPILICLGMGGWLVWWVRRGELRVKRIDDAEIRFKGCGAAFLDSLPDTPC